MTAASRGREPSRRTFFRGGLVVLALGLALPLLPQVQLLDAKLLDASFRLVRALAPRPSAVPIAIIGIDEATLRALPEPIALWHPHLADVLAALAQARPQAVGLDVELPPRSYDFVRLGSDRQLTHAILEMRAVAPIVLALGVNSAGQIRPIHAPFAAAAGEVNIGVAVWPLDADGRVRRFDERIGDGGAHVQTFIGALARAQGVQPQPGWIDFAAGEPFGYLPLEKVLGWFRAGDKAALQAAFERKLVLIGAVLPFTDRHPLPVRLAAWEAGLHAPGIVLHAQVLRALLGAGLVQPAGAFASFILAAVPAALWFAFGRLALAITATTLFVVIIGAVALSMLHVGIFLPLGAALLATALAGGVRIGYEAWFHRRERERLKRDFAGYVSPNVLALILRGELDTHTGSGRRRLCVLFADIRNFTAMSEHAMPEAVVAILNRYFERMTGAIHTHGGTVDNFRGDGIMCFFGAPQPVDNPCANGFRAARAMLDELAALNCELAAEGSDALQIGLSLAYGEAIVGRVGASERHEYTAIGDVANVSARLENMTKETGYPLLLTSDVLARLEATEAFDDLGRKDIRGHAPVHVYGWPPRRSQPRARATAPAQASG